MKTVEEFYKEMDEKTKETLNSVFEKLTDEQKEKAKACKSADELMTLFSEWDIELPDDLSAIVSGGVQLIPWNPYK